MAKKKSKKSGQKVKPPKLATGSEPKGHSTIIVDSTYQSAPLCSPHWKERLPKNEPQKHNWGVTATSHFLCGNPIVFTLIILIIDITDFHLILWSNRARISGRFPDITRGVALQQWNSAKQTSQSRSVQCKTAVQPSERISSLPDFDQRMSQAFVTLQRCLNWELRLESLLYTSIIFPKRKVALQFCQKSIRGCCRILSPNDSIALRCLLLYLGHFLSGFRYPNAPLQ